MKALSLLKLSACGLVVGLMANPLATVSAQTKPEASNSTFVVGFAAGGGADLTTRIVAKQVSEANDGMPIVVLNKPGAGGIVAHQSHLKAPKDGSEILLSSVGPLTVLPHMSNTGFDAQKDFKPVSMAVNFPNILVIPATLGLKNLDEFLAYVRKNPNKVNFASSGIGAASHMAGELLNQRAGLDMMHVPYKGGAPAMTDLISGRVDAYFAAPPSAKPHIESGKLIAIATSGPERSEQYPDIPALGEVYPGFNANNWYAFVAPAGTPDEVVKWWNQEIVKALKDPEVKNRMDAVGLDIAYSTPEELGEAIKNESNQWASVIKERNIKVDQ